MALENERYVLSLCDEVLGTPSRRQHTFDCWLLGDESPRMRLRKPLPVDGYWPNLALVVEVYERQHFEAVPHFDKPDKLTVSGVHRGEQRRLYDARRREVLPAHGISLVIIPTTDFQLRRGAIVRSYGHDLKVVRRALADFVTFGT